MSTDLLLGAFIGLILSVAASYIFEGLGFKARAAKLSTKRARARLDVLSKRLREAAHYEQNPVLMLNLVAGRLLLVTILWVTQSASEFLLGLLNNGLYTFSRFVGPVFNLDRDVTVVAIGIVISALSSTVLLIAAKLALDVYIVWRRVHRFDKYRVQVEAESAELEAVLQNSAG